MPDIIENASTEYAAILLDNLFAYAKDEKVKDIRIVSGRLFRGVFDKLVDQVKAVLDAGCSVKVITLCPSSEVEKTPFYETVANHEHGDVASLGKDTNSEKHFIVVGDSSYRLETDDNVSSAIASFNDRNGAVPLLKKKFEELWQEGRGQNGRGGSIRVGA